VTNATSGGPGRLAGNGAVAARAPAKVNVHLAVGPLREDGFHELQTVYLAVSLFDTVVVRRAEGLSLSVRGEGSATGRRERRRGGGPGRPRRAVGHPGDPRRPGPAGRPARQ
jgi:hypothetical protein